MYRKKQLSKNTIFLNQLAQNKRENMIREEIYNISIYIKLKE